MTPHAKWSCAKCGQQLREGDQYCMACGTKRDTLAGGREVGREVEHEVEREGGTDDAWEYARVAPRVADRQGDGSPGAGGWVYEAIGSHPTRGAFMVRISAAFSVADATFGPTLDWNGQLEGHEALAVLLTELRADGWQLVAGQWAADRLQEVLPGRVSDKGTSGEGWQLMVRQGRPIWSRLIFRRAASP